MKNRAIPRLRFKGFNDKWKNDKLKNLAQFINGKAFKQRDLLNKGKYPVIRVGNFYTDKKIYYSNKELPNKYYLNNKDLLYTWSATFGPHIWHGGKVIYHYHIWKIICKSAYKYFLLQLLNIDKNYIQKNGSTMAHITKYGMETKKVTIPSLPEQQLIGKFFAKLDKLIQLQQKKVALLKKLERGYLQKLFPRKCESVPRLRFKGFNDKWMRKSLKDIVTYINTGKSKRKGLCKICDSTYKYPFISASTLKGYSKAYDYKGVMLLCTRVGNVGYLHLVNGKFQISDNTIVIKGENNLYFIKGLLKTQKFQRIAEGSSQMLIREKELEQFLLLVPRFKEQEKINEFFKVLNIQIKYQLRKLWNLRKLKKAYLQKMFI